MSQRGSVASRPYAAVWVGNIPPLFGRQGVISTHKTPELAARRCRQTRDGHADFFRLGKAWFVYQVIDCRNGAIIQFIR